MERKKGILKEGTKVRYIGTDTVAYETGKIYTIEGYDEELDLYGVMSELDEIYCLDISDLEVV